MSVPTLVDEYTFNLIYEALEKIPDQLTVVELGSFLGGSAIRIVNKLLELKAEFDFHAIDNWECDNISHESREWSGVKDNFYDKFMENILGYPIRPIKMDTLQAHVAFKDNEIDLLFVDDGHQYPHTRDILKAWLPKVKTGGYIVGHDYSTNGVDMAVREVLGENVEFCETRSAYRYKKC